MIGDFVLFMSFFFTLFAFVSTVFALKFKKARLLESGRRALISTFILSSIACFRLLYAFFKDEFVFKYVAKHSSSDLPNLYKLTGLWAGQEGSLLFWFWLLTLFSAILILREGTTRGHAFRGKACAEERGKGDDILDHSLPVLAFTELFFAWLLIFANRPFERLPFTPENGSGLNPLLQNFYMVFHPPTLFVGYVGFTIPFALGFGSLLAGRKDDEWLRKSRRWAIFTWVFLTLGIILGAKWAYVELGWGGYWSWDPVENASFLPWLTATAFVHSIMMQERRDMFKFWNIMLVTLTFELCIFGTFITRSGLFSSVHSFAPSSIGYYLLIFMGLSIISTAFIAYLRKELLQSERKIDSVFSKEGMFLINNFILCAICFSTLLGTIFPIIAELFMGRKISVLPSFFNKVNAPLAIFLLLLTGICLLIPWRKASLSNFRRNFLIPLSISIVTTVPLAFLVGRSSRSFLLGILFGSFVSWSIILKAKKLGSLKSLLKNRRRYGGYIVHLGIAVLFIGIVSSSLRLEKTVANLKVGESFNLGGYTFKFDRISSEKGRNFEMFVGKLKVLKSEKELYELSPGKAFYPKMNEVTSEVDIRSGFFKDVYAALLNISMERASFKVYITPMVNWIWYGCWIMLIGSIFAFSHRSRKLREEFASSDAVDARQPRKM